MYVPPLKVIGRLPGYECNDDSVTLPKLALEALLRAAFQGDAFDARWYHNAYPDVAEAILAGDFPDEITHFVKNGYFEHRKPRSFDVNSDWYESHYSDVLSAIRAGRVSDARSHFNTNGYWEPRAPTPEAELAFGEILGTAAGQALEKTMEKGQNQDRRKS